MEEHARTVDNRPQLFFDNYLVEMVQDIRRSFHKPRKCPDRLIERDRPWEAHLAFSDVPWALSFDEREGLYRCWYEDCHVDFDRMAGSNVDITDPTVAGSRICYAYSQDGLRWTKPALDIMRYEGQQTNIVFGDAGFGPTDFGSIHAITVLDDLFESDPERRFKMLFQHVTAASPTVDATTDSASGLEVLQSPFRLAASPDGIHWTADERTLDFGGLGPKLGDVVKLIQDPDTRQYILYTRHPGAWNPPLNPKNPSTGAWSLPYYPHSPSRNNKRRIWRCESDDLIQWNEPYEVLVADDEEDNLDDSFNALCVTRVGELYVGYVSVLHSVSCELEVQLAYSRDGITWHRAANRTAFIPTGGPGDWDEHMTIVSEPPVEHGDELWIYYGGSNHHHNWWLVGLREGLDLPEVRRPLHFKAVLGRALLRREGFVSLEATDVREGIIVTHPVRLTGERLAFNAECGPDGYLDIEIADANDDIIEGFARSDFDRFSADAVRSTASWGGRSAIPGNGVVKLRLYLRDCRLYSLCSPDSGEKG